jgi:hypothetical protein
VERGDRANSYDEYALDKKEQEQHVQESLNAGISEAQRRRALVADGDGPLHVLEASQ